MINLDSEEKIIKIVRRHPIIFILETIFALFVTLIPIIGYLFLSFSHNLDIILSEKTLNLFWFGYLIITTIIWFVVFVIWTDYYLDCWIITNKNLIDVQQKGLFHRHIATCRFERIQDIKVVIPGLIANIFGYGDVHVQTAGSNKEFVIYDSINPYIVKQILVDNIKNDTQT